MNDAGNDGSATHIDAAVRVQSVGLKNSQNVLAAAEGVDVASKTFYNGDTAW